MAARQPTTIADDTDPPTRHYAAALRTFAHSAAGGLSDALLTPLFPLNAVYYLRDLLPPDLHRESVRAAADLMTAAAERAQPANGPAVLAARTVRPQTLNRLAGTRDDPATAATLLQHVLEIEPLLTRPQVRAVRIAVHEWLSAMPAAPEQHNRRWATARGALAGWAACNARPPREGEVAAWASCLGRRPAIELAQQALAGGLRFAALLDALSLAAARRLHMRPFAENASGLIAAHAVRRLSEIAGKPALAVWLGVAGALTVADTARTPRDAEPAPEPTSLALAAIESGDPLLLQAAEAALMEAEALPVDLRRVPLLALERLLEAERRGTEPAPAHNHQADAAVTAAGGNQP